MNLIIRFASFLKTNPMKNATKKFLEFNGKSIHFLAIDGQYWIALKPICEALNVSWKYQHEKLKKDKFLSQLSREIGMVAADGKLREMTSLPEYVIYGWIFKLESNSEGMDAYQWECYRILYEHFHGSITGRKELLSEKARVQLEIDRCFNTLDPLVALRLETASKQLNKINAQLRVIDNDVIEEEKTLFDT